MPSRVWNASNFNRTTRSTPQNVMDCYQKCITAYHIAHLIALRSQWRIPWANHRPSTICSKLCLRHPARRRATNMICASSTPRRACRRFPRVALVASWNGGAKLRGSEIDGPTGFASLFCRCAAFISRPTLSNPLCGYLQPAERRTSNRLPDQPTGWPTD